MKKIGLVILGLLLLSYSIKIGNAQLTSSESNIFSDDFEAIGNSSLTGWTIWLCASLGDDLHSDYIIEYPSLTISGRTIPSSSPYMPLNSSEYEKALGLFQEHTRVTDEDKFSGSRSFLADLSSLIDSFGMERDFSTSGGGLIDLQFAIKLEGSREIISGDAWSRIGGGGVFGPDGSPLWFDIIGRGTDRVAWLRGEKDGQDTTTLFELNFDQWFEIEMVVDISTHSYCVLVDGSYGINGPYTSSDLTSRAWNTNTFRSEFYRWGVSQLKVYLDDFKVKTISPADLWKGSYISTYYSSLPWHPKIAEIHISAQDALASGTTAYVLVVEKLASGGEQIAGKIPTGGALLQTIFKAIGEAVSGNPDGSYDFTAMEIAGGVGWFYGGSFSKGTILPVAISYWPIPIPLFNLPTPGQFNLIYSDVPNANLIQNVISAGQTIISLFDPNGKLYLMVQDTSGRRTGVDALLNETITEIPGSIYAEYKSNMAVVLPINVTSFTCMVDGRKASQQSENYTLTVETVVNGDIASSKTFTSQINKGQVANYTVQISNGMIETVPPATPFVYLVYLAPVVILVVAISLLTLHRKRKRFKQTKLR